MFTNGPGGRGSILSRVIPKRPKIVLDAALLNTQHYKLLIKVSGAIQGMKQHPPLNLGVVVIEKRAFGSSSTKVANFTLLVGDRGSIPGRVIPKTQKMVLDSALLNNQHYTVRIKSKGSNSGNGVVPSLRVAFNYGRQLNLLNLKEE